VSTRQMWHISKRFSSPDSTGARTTFITKLL
jgi:hypothetical protein